MPKTGKLVFQLGLCIRSLIFYVGFYVSVFFHSAMCVMVCPLLPEKRRFAFVTLVTRFIGWWLKTTCKINVDVKGANNIITDQSYIVMCNHQSAWETFFLQTLFSPLSTVLKEELMRIPLFGWALRFSKPIAIDRSQKFKSLKKLISQGKDRLEKGISVLIFPEGTFFSKVAPEEYLKGGAALASSTMYPILPVVHNSGEHWPPDRLLKKPGTIQVVIGPAIHSENHSVDEIQKKAVSWIKEAINKID
ncbi:MAG: 1-acyl-sn-glycerol-3-phosphate acyltransferase [Deltaproteobacteria bacterium]|nr:1-acyl-sn-glycerol-3-phosphate acyltransferase [Deltaproteobacteria bacterium]